MVYEADFWSREPIYNVSTKEVVCNQNIQAETVFSLVSGLNLIFYHFPGKFKDRIINEN